MLQISELRPKGLLYLIKTASLFALAVSVCSANQPLRPSTECLHSIAQPTRLALLCGLFCANTARFRPAAAVLLIGLSLVRLWQKSRAAASKKISCHE